MKPVINKKSKGIISNYYNKPKSMSMKLIEIVSSVESLNKLSETKLPASVAFSLSKFLKSVTLDVENYNKVRGEKVIEYGLPAIGADGKQIVDEKGNLQYTFADPVTKELTENGKKFVAELAELENKELDLTIPEVKISDLGKAEIEPKYLVSLQWLIKE